MRFLLPSPCLPVGRQLRHLDGRHFDERRLTRYDNAAVASRSSLASTLQMCLQFASTPWTTASCSCCARPVEDQRRHSPNQATRSLRSSPVPGPPPRRPHREWTSCYRLLEAPLICVANGRRESLTVGVLHTRTLYIARSTSIHVSLILCPQCGSASDCHGHPAALWTSSPYSTSTLIVQHETLRFSSKWQA